ncbi:MAG: glycerol-3-phosphate 1-O-acyltransferase PlsY [Candidatus Goldiibacteriota bacterium]|jgi:glycerol-3-phosphate acyltransferase PlsY
MWPIALLAALVIPYFLGAIPTGYLIVKSRKNIDIRTVGSGNIGATNVKRVLGMKWFVIVLILDALKGFVPVFALGAVFGAKFPWVPVIAGIAAVLGHTFTIFLKFKGGKGVATALGVFLALSPAATITAFIVFAVTVSFFRYISAGSVLAALLLPVFVLNYGEGGFWNLVQITSILVAAFVIYKHKDNIKRLMDGTESRFEFGAAKKEKEAGSSGEAKK